MNVERDKLNYEVLDVKIKDNSIEIIGWATMPHTQHFEGTNTHAYELELKSDTETLFIDGLLTNQDLTKQMSFDGNRKCNAGVMNTITCDFNHQMVGFKFNVPLSRLKEDKNYKAYLKMYAKQSNKKYRIPLFYASNKDQYLQKNRIEYIIESDYSHLKFSIFGHTLRARMGPSPKTEAAKGGKSCSFTFGNNWYLKQYAIFNNIYDINLYNNQITYFKVRVKTDTCINDRMRIIESTTGNNYIHVPSTHVNYIGNPMTIHVRKLKSTPIINVSEAFINQYESYDPFLYAKASDKYDGNITSKIKVKKTNVNTRIPGVYQTCYEVLNSSNRLAEACGTVVVLKKPSIRRFISKYTIHDTSLSRWNRIQLRDKLYRRESLMEEEIKS